MEIRIDNNKCMQCGRCVQICPSVVFEREKGQVPLVVRGKSCIGCGHCVDVCKGNAIEHESFPVEHIHEVRRELLPTPESLMELIRSRRSNRTITEKDIPQQALLDIVEAAYYAPTAENSRKVVVTVLDNAEQIQAVEDTTMRFFLKLAHILLSPVLKPISKRLLPDLYAEVPELFRFERRWKNGECPCCCNAKALVVFSAPRGYDFGWQDCNLAYQNASLMAEAHGVSQIYMGLVQSAFKFMLPKKVECLLDLPKGHRPYALMALGMPAYSYIRYTERKK